MARPPRAHRRRGRIPIPVNAGASLTAEDSGYTAPTTAEGIAEEATELDPGLLNVVRPGFNAEGVPVVKPLSAFPAAFRRPLATRAFDQGRLFAAPTENYMALYRHRHVNDPALSKEENLEARRNNNSLTLYNYLKKRWADRAPVELIEVIGRHEVAGVGWVYTGRQERRLLLTMEHDEGDSFPLWFLRVIQAAMFRGSQAEAEWGAVIAFPLPVPNPKSTVVLRNWKHGGFNCLVKPIVDRLRRRVLAMQANMAARPTTDKAGLLRRYENKVAVAERTLEGVALVGIGSSLVRVLCEQIHICVEVRSLITAPHKTKCSVCLRFVLDSSTHVCGENGSARVVDFVTIFKCDKTRNKNDLRFVFIETRDGHVDLAPGVAVKNTCFMTESGECEEVEDLGPLYEQLVAEDTLFAFKQDRCGRVTRIMRPSAAAVSAPSNRYWKVHGAFMRATGLDMCFVDAVQQPELSSFIVSGMAHNTTVDAPWFDHVDDGGASWIGSIDMRRAYANVAHCGYYSGYLGKIHEFRRMSRMQAGRNGMYWVSVTHVPAVLDTPFTVGWFVDGVYTSPELLYWETLGVLFTVHAGCVGCDLQFDFNEHPDVMQRYSMDGGSDDDGVRGYCLSTGVFQCHALTETYSLFLGSKCMDLFRVMPNVYVNDDMRTATAVFPRWSSKHLCHVVAFIFAYVRIGVMQQVLSMGGSVLRVCVDGIYYDKRTYTPPVGCVAFDTVWAEDDVVRVGNDPCDSYVVRDLGFTMANLGTLSGRPCMPARESLLYGMGGNGKSHVVCTDIFLAGNPADKTRLESDGGCNGGFIRPLLLVPTHAQRADKMKSYPGITVWTHARLFNFLHSDGHPNVRDLKSNFNVLLFDECSMIPESIRAVISAMFATHLIVWLGDVGYQCPPFPVVDDTGVKVDRPEFNLLAVACRTHLSTNYRIKCPALLLLASDLRSMIDRQEPPIVAGLRVRQAVRKITLGTIGPEYRPGDLVICRTHDQISAATAVLCNVFGQFRTGRNRVVTVLPPRCLSAVPYTTAVISKWGAMHCHGFTVHAAQGQTVHRPRRVFICMSRDMEVRVLYTAITRCEYLDQLYWYEDGGGVSGLVARLVDSDDGDSASEEHAEAMAAVDVAISDGVDDAWVWQRRIS